MTTHDAMDTAVAALMRDAATRAILPYYQMLASDQIVTKSETPALTDVVTIADAEAEAILSDGLARLLPEAAIVGEEAAHADPALMDKLGDALCWVIDPLDGTNNFAAGKPPFGIMIALAEHGETIAGWILDPLSGRLCHTRRGDGAFIDGVRITAQETGLTPPVAAISLVFMDPARRAAVVEGVIPNYAVVDIPRCAAEQYPRLALGINDCSVFERTLAWDHAAGVLFLNEAGGKAARNDGSAYRLDDHRSGLIGAASPRLWDDLAARIADIPDN